MPSLRRRSILSSSVMVITALLVALLQPAAATAASARSASSSPAAPSSPHTASSGTASRAAAKALSWRAGDGAAEEGGLPTVRGAASVLTREAESAFPALPRPGVTPPTGPPLPTARPKGPACRSA